MRRSRPFRGGVAGAYAPFLRAQPTRTSDAVSCQRGDTRTLLPRADFRDSYPVQIRKASQPKGNGNHLDKRMREMIFDGIGDFFIELLQFVGGLESWQQI